MRTRTPISVNQSFGLAFPRDAGTGRNASAAGVHDLTYGPCRTSRSTGFEAGRLRPRNLVPLIAADVDVAVAAWPMERHISRVPFSALTPPVAEMTI
jgi:hypothetical protein